jgi:HAD superfamily hydrolase (TIGR01490 family)
MTLAIFDLDNTLLHGDSDHAWGEFMVEQQLVDGEVYRRRNDEFYEAYKRGELIIEEYLAFALEPLSRLDTHHLQQLHARFMAEKVAPMRLPAADALIARHRAEGHFLLIITATNRFVTGPIAQALGMDDLLATDPECLDGRYTGRVAGTPCFREGKVARLQSWLKDTGHSLDGSHFYSDSINDLPLLEAVTHPVAVDPDERLRQEAGRRGWPVISLRGTAP